MKSSPKTLVIIFFNIVFTFLLSEVALRCWLAWNEEDQSDFDRKVAQSTAPVEKTVISGPVTMGRLIRKSHDKNRVYELIPHLQATFLGKSLSTNSFGIRDQEYSLEKPENTIRIVGIGDSVMFGWGVEENESYLSLIEQDLNSSASPNQKFEVLNFAVPGYNTTMEAASLTSLAKHFRPDVVVVHLVSNDFGVPLFMQTPQNYFNPKQSYLWERFRNILRQKEGRGLIGIEAMGSEQNQKKKVIAQYQHMLGESGFRRAMRTISDTSNEIGARVIVLTGKLPRRHRQMIEKKVIAPYRLDLVEANTTVEEYMRKNAVPNNPEERKKLLWLSESDSHPSTLGHRLYADALLKRLKPILAEKHAGKH